MIENPNRRGAPANQQENTPKPSDADRPDRNPNEHSERAEDADPHPSTEEGYGRDSKVRMTGL